jgi:predicted nucleotidyltransferase
MALANIREQRAMLDTTYPDADRVLAQLVRQLQTVLGPALVGVYLYGSRVWGDFDPTVSDLDLLAVTTSDIDDAQFAALHTMHAGLAAQYPAWDNRIEVAYLSTRALDTYRTRPSRIAVISPGEPFHFKPAGHDWLINWYVVREYGRTLLGPAPTTLIAPITHQEFIQTVRDHAAVWPTWIDNTYSRKAQAYAILTLCRALYTVHHGTQPSKPQAATWAATQLPAWSALIEQALSWRTAPDDPAADHAATLAATRAFVTQVAARIAATADPK